MKAIFEERSETNATVPKFSRKCRKRFKPSYKIVPQNE